MNIKSNRFLFVVFFLGWVFDLLFWRKPMGINFAVFLLLCLLVGIYTLITNGLQQSKKSLYLLFPFLFLW